jgi:hypothetical protein
MLPLTCCSWVELRVSSFRTSEWGVSGHRNAAARTAAVAGVSWPLRW